MAEQQLLLLNKEAAETESHIHAALAKLEATTDPDMKQIWQREYTRLVGEKEQLQAESNIHAALAELKATTDPDMKQIWQRVLNTRLVEKEQLQVRRKELEKQVGGGGAGPSQEVAAILEATKATAEAAAKAAKAAEEAAQRTEQQFSGFLSPCQLEETHTALQDDIRSWNSSHTTEASRVSVSDIQLLRRLLRIRLEPFDDCDSSQVLHPSACDADYEWDNTPEPSQRQQYMAVIAENIQQGLFERIVWKPQTKAEIVIRGLGHRVVAKSDELLCAKKWQFLPDAGCLIGIELKKDLTQASRRQGEAEFIAFSLTSNFPFLQFVTDMKRGGLAYYKHADDDGHQVVKEQVLQGMDSIYDALNAALSSLPNSLTAVRGDVHVPSQLPQPQRCKLVDPFIMQAAASVHDAGPDCGDDALDELSAWFSKEQLAATGDLPDAYPYSDQAVAQ